MSQSKVSLKSSALKQGLALVLIPGVIGVATFATIYQFWTRSSEVLTTESVDAQLSIQVNEVIEAWNGLGQRNFWQVFGSKDGTLRSPDEFERRIRIALQKIEKAKAADSAFLKNIDAVRKELDAERKLFGAVYNNTTYLGSVDEEHPATTWDNVEKSRTILKILTRFVDLKQRENRIIQNIWDSLKTAQHERDRKLLRFEYFVAAMLCLNAMLSMVLSWLVASFISKRVKQLVNCSKSYLAGDFAAQGLGGSDELSFLQTVLRSSFETVYGADAHRRLILSMVAHDIRSPLMSVRANFHLVEEFADGLSEEALEILLQIYSLLDRTQESAEEGLREKSADGFESVLIDLQERPHFDDEPHRRRVGLFNKLLVLSLVPLLVHAGTLAFVYSNISDVRSVITTARTEINGLMLKNLALLSSVTALNSQFLFIATKQPICHDAAVHGFSKATEQIDALTATVADSDLGRRYASLFRREISQFQSVMMDPKLVLEPLSETLDTINKLGDIHNKEESNLTSRSIESRWRAESLKQVESSFLKVQSAADNVRNGIFLSLSVYLVLELAALVSFVLLVNNGVLGLSELAKRIGKTGTKNKSDYDSSIKEFFSLGSALTTADQKLLQVNDNRKKLLKVLSFQLRAPILEIAREESRFRTLTANSLPDQCLEYLDSAKHSAEQVADILDDLLTVESLEVGKLDLNFHQVDLNSLLKSSISGIESIAKINDTRLVLECDSIEIKADERRLRRVVTNLITNAIKFSEFGSAVHLRGLRRADGFRIEVQDEGPGLSLDEIERVFEPRYRTTQGKSKDGHGLGLAICKMIVESHGGTIGVDSVPGSGCLFWLEIPPQEQIK